MLPKNHIIFNSYYIILILRIMVIKIFQYFQFHSRLILELFLIPNDFNSTNRIILMINALQCLSKTTSPQNFNHLIPIANMIINNSLVLSILIIVSIVENIHLSQSFLLNFTYLHLILFLISFLVANSVFYCMPFYFLFAILAYIVNLAIIL